MKQKLLFITLACFLISIGDVYPNNNFPPKQDYELAKRKKKKRSKKRSSKKKSGNNDKKMWVALSGGLAIPLGDFASSEFTIDITNPDISSMQDLFSGATTAGANLGFTGSISFVYKFIDYLGAEAFVGYQTHSGKTFSVPSITTVPGIDFELLPHTLGSWNIIPIMAGPHGSLALGDSPISLEARALLGVGIISSPTITSIDPITITKTETPSYSSTSFAYQAGIGAKYNLSDMFCLLLNLDYFGTKFSKTISVPETTQTIPSSIPGFPDQTVTIFGYDWKMEKSISSFNISIGFGFRF